MKTGLTATDWIVVGIYFAIVAILAARVSKNQRSPRDYFLGGRSLPWWAAALSIIATETSAVTFVGVPAMAYSGDWSLLQLVLGFILGRVILARYFVRVFYREEYETVYGYLGRRFGLGARMAASFLFLCGRIVGSGVRLLAGCMALGVAIDMTSAARDPQTVITALVVAVGLVGTAFTLFGGIKAVVWTDVLLGVTFIAGALLSVVYMLAFLPSAGELFTTEAFRQKTTVLHWSWGLDDGTAFLAGIIGGFFLTLATHGTDQDIAQRMLTCSDDREGSRSVIASAFVILPLFALFLFVGTLLSFYYAENPPPYDLPQVENDIFPTFIVYELPPGVAGFVVAGLLAASLSSFTSALNALAATAVCDFYRPFRHLRGETGRDDLHYLKVSRAVTLVWGVVLVIVALGLYGSEENIVSVALSVLTYFYGGLLGAFLLGIFTARGTNATVLSGMLISIPVVLLLQLRQYVEAPEKAPQSIRGVVVEFPESLTRGILAWIPDVTWHYWILPAIAITMAVGALGRRGERSGARTGLPDL